MAMAQRPVTLTDIVSGHVSLEIEGFDRLYFNGWVPALQTSGQIAGALAEGIAVTPLANGFAATSDPARLQELCDMVQARTVRVFSGTWMSRIPLPLTTADREHRREVPRTPPGQ
jgi:hypothetical protein